MSNIFEQYFYLRDHPFAPDNGRYVRPERPINLFAAGTDADRYFAPLNPFAKALKDVDEFLQDYTGALEGGQPPSLLVLGPPGSGRNTVAAYAAWLARKEYESSAPGGLGFSDLEATSEDIARVLDELRQIVVDHLERHGVSCAGTLKNAGPFDPNAPNQIQNERLFKTLANRVPPELPINIVAIGPITARRESWMATLRGLLAPLRVMTIFLTDDSTVAATFDDDAVHAPSLSVAIEQLMPDDGIALLKHRFDVLKTDDRAKRAPNEIYPYSDELVRGLFPGKQPADIKYLISVCNAAFNSKLSELRRSLKDVKPPPALALTLEDVAQAIRSSGRRR